MTFKVGNQTIEGKVTLGPPILLIKGKSTAEQPKAHVTPEKLKAFQEALGKLFGMESILLSAEILKPTADHPRPRACLACGTEDESTLSSHWDDVQVQI